MTYRILELYCGAGGSAVGYSRAGFEVVGVDSAPQPRFPFRFIQADAIEFLEKINVAKYFDAIHAGPPCQAYSATRHLHTVKYPKLIGKTRRLLEATGLPYVIENVEGARSVLHDPIQLCGSAFGLRVRRHRLFECGFPTPPVPPCEHKWQDADKRFFVQTSVLRKSYKSGILGVYGGGQGLGKGEIDVWRAGMGIPWMTKTELVEAIPPPFTQYLGSHLIYYLLGHDNE